MRNGYACVTFVCSNLRIWCINQVWKWGLFHTHSPIGVKPFHSPNCKRGAGIMQFPEIFSPVGAIKIFIFLFLWASNVRSKPFIFYISLKMAKMSNFSLIVHGFCEICEKLQTISSNFRNFCGLPIHDPNSKPLILFIWLKKAKR